MVRAGERQRDQQRPEGARHLLRPAARGERAEDDHHRQQGEDEPERVGLEDQLDRVADRGQLDEGAHGGDADVALEVGLLPEGDRGGERDQGQRGRDLAGAEVDRGAHAITSSSGPASIARPVLEPHHPVAQPPRLLGVVADQDDRDLELAAQLGEGRLDRVAGGVVEGRGRLVEQQDGRLLGERAGQHRPLLLADRELGDVAPGELRIEAGEAQAALGVQLLAGEPGRVGEVRLDRPLQQGRQLRHQRDLAAQGQRVVLAERPAAVGDRPRVGVGEPVEQAQQGRLAGPRGPDDRGRAGRDRGADRVEDAAIAAGQADLAAARTAPAR